MICPVTCGDAKLDHGQLRVQETNLASSRTLLETPRTSTDHVVQFDPNPYLNKAGRTIIKQCQFNSHDLLLLQPLCDFEFNSTLLWHRI